MNKGLTTALLSVAVILLIIALIIKIHAAVNVTNESNWNYRQIEKIDTTKNEFSFIVFGDNKNSIRTFEDMIARINEEDSLFAIGCGDFVYDGSKEKYNFVLKQLKKFDKPIVTVVGNHDIADYGRENYYNIFGNYYYSFSVGDVYFIILDNANEIELDPWQMDWLKGELKRSQSFQYRFVFMHVPLYDPRIEVPKKPILYIPVISEYEYYTELYNRTQALELSRLFNQYHVTHVFVSHIHGYYTGLMGDVPYTVTGGAGAELFGSDPEHYFYHYIKVSIAKDEVKHDVVRLQTPKPRLNRILDFLWVYIYAYFAIKFWDFILTLAGSFLVLYFVINRRDVIFGSIRKQ
jgi:glyoxylase-like metal-dependent hydrolase (beta-lactamase superfamily II)